MRVDVVPGAEEIAGYYDTIAAGEGFQARMYVQPHDRLRMKRTETILGLVLPFAPQVLELGCADGIWSAWIAARVGRLVGIDVARPCIRRCRSLGLGNAVFVHGRLEDLEDPGTFDLAVATEVLEHVPDPAGTLARLSELARGVLVSVPINEKPNPRAFEVEAFHRPLANGDGSGHIWSFRRETVRALFSELWHYEEVGICAIALGRRE